MRGAYSLLGVAFVVVFGLGYFLLEKAHAPGDIASPPVSVSMTSTFSLTSSAFKHNEKIPSQYTCDGENVNPPLGISGKPEGTQSFVLIVEDPDIPQVVKERLGVDVIDHWVVYNIPASTTEFPEKSIPPGTVGMGIRKAEYTGPCPPPEYEPREHRYIFTLYALSSPPTLAFIKAPTKADILGAVENSIIASTTLIGRYERTLPAS